MSKKRKLRRLKKETKLYKTLRIIRTVIFAVVLAFLAGIVLIAVTTRANGKTPFVFGYSIQRVSSPSMVPTLEVGDIILCKQCDPMELEKNDIITYQGKHDQFKGKLVTHRVVKPPYEKDGEYYLVTRGDDNPTDDSPIKVSDVVGKYDRTLEFLTPMYEFFITPWGLLAILGLILIAFFGDILNFVKALLGFTPVEKNDVEEIIERYYNEQKGELPEEEENSDALDDDADENAEYEESEPVGEEPEETSSDDDSEDEETGDDE